MRKDYDSPEFELKKFDFESILEEHYIEHSKGEGFADGGDEGRD